MKSFRLFKRRDDGTEMPPTESGYKDRPYYFRFSCRGKSYVRALDTAKATEAQDRARAKYNEIVRGVITGEYDRIDHTKIRQDTTGKIKALLEAYTDGPSDASLSTRKNNCSSLCQIVAETGSIRDLTPVAVRAFFADVNKKALAEPDQATAASMRRTANAVWRKAKSLFTPKCLEHYRQLDLFHPCMIEFVNAGEAAKFTGRSVPKVAYNPPTDAIIAKTLKAWDELADTNRDLYLAIGHELSFGLRISEVAQVQWDWHQVRNGYPVLDSSAHVKDGSGLLQVRALDPFFSQMMATVERNKWRGEPEDFIIPGSNAYRTDGLFRAATNWLRTLGWKTHKTNHALRAYTGGLIAMRYSIYEAQMFLRHSSVKVTESNYAHFIQKFKPADIESIPARWAVADATPKSADATSPAKAAKAAPKGAKSPANTGAKTQIASANRADATSDATFQFQVVPPGSGTQPPETDLSRN